MEESQEEASRPPKLRERLKIGAVQASLCLVLALLLASSLRDIGRVLQEARWQATDRNHKSDDSFNFACEVLREEGNQMENGIAVYALGIATGEIIIVRVGEDYVSAEFPSGLVLTDLKNNGSLNEAWDQILNTTILDIDGDGRIDEAIGSGARHIVPESAQRAFEEYIFEWEKRIMPTLKAIASEKIGPLA